MKLSDIKGDEALDMLADLLEPIVEIATDKEITGNMGKDNMKAVKVAIKNHKEAITAILAILNKENPKTYKPSLLELPAMLVDVFNDEELIRLFQSQVQIPQTSSGLATENTEVEKN
jgi:hypothetical protein